MVSMATVKVIKIQSPTEHLQKTAVQAGGGWKVSQSYLPDFKHQ